MAEHRRPFARLAAIGVGVVAMVLATDVEPAHADPAGPTHLRSTVTAVTADDGQAVPLEVEVIGGDAFLVVRARPGVTVEVPGYEGEPYLRMGADGTIEVNDRSPARWLNEERYLTRTPDGADADAPPRWVQVGDGHEYAWHDHRVHFMSPRQPPGVDTQVREVQPVLDWEVPLVVDGRPVTVTGSLVWVPSPGPLVPVGAALSVAALLFALRRRLTPLVTAAVAVAAALAVSVPMVTGLPPGADGDVALVALPVVGAVLALVGARWPEGRRAGLVQAVAAVPLLVWVVLLRAALTRPIVPGPLSVGVVQVAVVLVALAGVATVASALRPPTLDADGPPPDQDTSANWR